MKSGTVVKGSSGLSSGITSGIVSALSLLRIEFRRSAGFLLIPVIVAGSWLFGWSYLGSPVTLWSDGSVLLRDLGIFAAPFLGGIAAWMAGRERRRGAGELLETTPRPELSRHLTTWSATALWGILAYALIGAVILLITYLRATWGSPAVLVILVGGLTFPACAALGHALGYYAPSRFTAPLVAIGLFAGQFLAAIPRFPLTFLSPAVMLEYEVWFGVKPDGIQLPQVLFLIGLVGVGLGSLAISRRRGVLRWGGLLGGGAFVMLGAVIVPPNPAASPDVKPPQYEMVAYEPVCEDGIVPVCVHPAYEPALGEITTNANQIMEPLADLPALPERIEQLPSDGFYFWGKLPAQPPDKGTLGLELYSYAGSEDVGTMYAIAAGLVSDTKQTMPAVKDQPLFERGSAAQNAIQVWLLRREGLDPTCGNLGSSGVIKYDTASCKAAERFAVLTPAEQRTWLEENYADLRAGKLTLKDLP